MTIDEKPINDCTLNQAVHKAIKHYLENLQGVKIAGLYDLVLSEVEPALLETVLHHSGGNQSQAATLLGLNRGTLRKKLKQYNLVT